MAHFIYRYWFSEIKWSKNDINNDDDDRDNDNDNDDYDKKNIDRAHVLHNKL